MILQTVVSILVKATKTHFYYAMRNHDGSEEGFHKYLLNIIPRYQVKDSENTILYENISLQQRTVFISFYFFNKFLWGSDPPWQDSWTSGLTAQVRRITLSQRSLLAAPPLDKGNEDSGNEIAVKIVPKLRKSQYA